MVITNIERQKRNPRRVNISIDGDFAFGIDDEVLVTFGLRKGDTITPDVLHSLQSSEEYTRAKQKALQLIGYRKRTEKELRTKLREKEFPPAIIDRVIEQLRTNNLLNDKEFSRSFIHDAQLRMPAGRHLLQRQLRLKGVSPSIIQETLDETVDPEEERERALDAAKKILKRFGRSRAAIDEEKQERRLSQFLVRRGFSWSTIAPVLRRLFHTTHEEA